MNDVVLYASIGSRSIAAYWMLEELGIPYRVEDVDLKEGKHKRSEYLAINPSGRVPAVSVDGVVITERPAICALLADRFGYGALAPRIEAPERGPYFQWLTYSTAVIDPAIAVYVSKPAQPLREMTWGDADHVVDRLATELAHKKWLLGDWFTAADIAVGAVLAMALPTSYCPRTISYEPTTSAIWRGRPFSARRTSPGHVMFFRARSRRQIVRALPAATLN